MNDTRSIDEQCPFDIGQIDDVEFAGTRDIAAIYNISPVLPGHSLIIPRRHAERMFDLTDSECLRLVKFARSVTALVVELFSASGFDWTVQDGEAAGQTVPHLHLHIIPRYDGDLPDPGDWYPRLNETNGNGVIDSAERRKLSDPELEVIVKRLRREARGAGLSAPSDP